MSERTKEVISGLSRADMITRGFASETLLAIDGGSPDKVYEVTITYLRGRPIDLDWNYEPHRSPIMTVGHLGPIGLADESLVRASEEAARAREIISVTRKPDADRGRSINAELRIGDGPMSRESFSWLSCKIDATGEGGERFWRAHGDAGEVFSDSHHRAAIDYFTLAHGLHRDDSRELLEYLRLAMACWATRVIDDYSVMPDGSRPTADFERVSGVDQRAAWDLCKAALARHS